MKERTTYKTKVLPTDCDLLVPSFDVMKSLLKKVEPEPLKPVVSTTQPDVVLKGTWVFDTESRRVYIGDMDDLGNVYVQDDLTNQTRWCKCTELSNEPKKYKINDIVFDRVNKRLCKVTGYHHNWLQARWANSELLFDYIDLEPYDDQLYQGRLVKSEKYGRVILDRWCDNYWTAKNGLGLVPLKEADCIKYVRSTLHRDMTGSFVVMKQGNKVRFCVKHFMGVVEFRLAPSVPEEEIFGAE